MAVPMQLHPILLFGMRWVAGALVALLAQESSAQQVLPVEQWSSAGWRERNAAAARLIADPRPLAPAIIEALADLVLPPLELDDLPPLGYLAGRTSKPEVIVAMRARPLPVAFGPRSAEDLVLPFPAKALALLVLQQRRVQLSEAQFVASLDALLVADSNVVLDLLAGLVAPRRTEAIASLRARLTSGTVPWTSTRPLVAVARAIGALGPEGRECLFEVAESKAGERARQAALIGIGLQPWSGSEGARLVKLAITAAGPGGAALGALQNARNDASWTDVVGDLVAGCRSVDIEVRERSESVLRQLEWSGRVDPEVITRLAGLVMAAPQPPASVLAAALGWMEKPLPDKRVLELEDDVVAKITGFACGDDEQLARAAIDVLGRMPDNDAAVASLVEVAFLATARLRTTRVELARNFFLAGHADLLRSRLAVAITASLQRIDGAARPAWARGIGQRTLRELDPGLDSFLQGELAAPDRVRVHAAVVVLAQHPDLLMTLTPDLLAKFAAEPSLRRILSPAVMQCDPVSVRELVLDGALGEITWTHPAPDARHQRAMWLDFLKRTEVPLRTFGAAALAEPGFEGDAEVARAMLEHLTSDARAVRLYCSLFLNGVARGNQLGEILADARAKLRTRFSDGAASRPARLDAVRTLWSLDGIGTDEIDVLATWFNDLDRGEAPRWHSWTPRSIEDTRPWSIDEESSHLSQWDVLWLIAHAQAPARLATPKLQALLEGLCSTDDWDPAFVEAARSALWKVRGRG